MITAIDTNILLDVWLPDPVFGPASLEALKRCTHEGALIICEIVYAELATVFDAQRRLDETLSKAGIQIRPCTSATLWKAGELWRRFHRSKRHPPISRHRILPDFLIGSHAMVQAGRLLSRDRGFYRAYFNTLTVVSPL